MSSMAISQEELNLLLQSSHEQKKTAVKPNFMREKFIEKVALRKNELNADLQRLRITVTQKEVDDLIGACH